MEGKKLAMFSMVMVALAVGAIATMEDDEKDCADQLANLAACIPFVSGTAKKPTPECCDDTRKVKSAKPKCLCVLIKESTDPSLGLPINTTLAIQMPSACNIDAKVSDCPSILKLPADSPDAKIFKGMDAGSSTGSSTTQDPATSAASTSPGSSSTSSPSSSGTDKSSDSKTTSSSSGVRELGGEILVTVFSFASVAWIFM